MDEKMEIRELKMQDSKDVEGMMLKIFSVEPWNDDWSDREQLRQYVQELMGNRNSLSFGLYEDGGLIGISLGRIKHWCEGTEYWITEKEFELLESRLEKYPFRMENWISGMAVTLYHNAPDNLVAVMEMEDGERQMLYGAVSEESYEKLLDAVAEIGEPV